MIGTTLQERYRIEAELGRGWAEGQSMSQKQILALAEEVLE
jgi:hypothetical protein